MDHMNQIFNQIMDIKEIVKRLDLLSSHLTCRDKTRRFYCGA